MELDGSGDESAAAAGPARGKKRPPSPSTPTSDGEDSSKSTTSDEDDWAVSDEEEMEGQDKGKYRPFTVDDFPRVSCDHDEQCNAQFGNSEIRCRGPKPLMLFPAFKGGRHAFGEHYHLYDESERISAADQCADSCNFCCAH